MKLCLLCCLLLFCTYSNSWACLNFYYSVDQHGHLHDAEELKKAFNTNFNLPLIEKKLLKLKQQLEQEADYKLLSDYAVLLLKAGKTKPALAIFEQLYQEHPEEYQLAANLGTAYELDGNLEQALFYIKRGLELHSNAHEGSEWVHVKILEAKLKLQEDPNYLSTHSILELTDQQKNDPEVCQQIHIQVHERFPFSPPFNPVMANLLIDLGDCYANTASIEYAKALYTIAKHYHGSKDNRIDKKLSKMLALRKQYADVQPEQTGEGDHLRIGGIRYRKLLDDNNPSGHSINWKQLPTHPEKLLAQVGITPAPALDSALVVREESEANPPSSSTANLSYFIVGFFIFSALALLFILRKKQP